jgi:hypothetical protein
MAMSANSISRFVGQVSNLSKIDRIFNLPLRMAFLSYHAIPFATAAIFDGEQIIGHASKMVNHRKNSGEYSLSKTKFFHDPCGKASVRQRDALFGLL